MKKNIKNNKIQIIVTAAGAILLLLIAVFCYHTVKEAIVSNEKESIISIAKVSTHSLETSLLAKSNLVYAAMSGDMESEEDIRRNMLKTGEKSKYIPITETDSLKKWEKQACEEARVLPGEVTAGPVIHMDDGYFALYLTKAVYMEGSIAGYVQVELNLDDVYRDEQALSGLNVGNQRYCIVKNNDGVTIMADEEQKDEEIAFAMEDGENCELVWSYEVEKGTPKRTRKLAAYDTAEFAGEKFILCIIEDYDGIVAPIDRIAFYLTVLGVVLLMWIGSFIYRFMRELKEEEHLKRELKYAKELNEANEALKNQENLMQKYNHSKTAAVLTGAIAHEFNNLMTPIVLYSELFAENEAIQKEMPQEVQELAMSAKRCEELARQLLDYSRQGRAEKVMTDYNATFAVQSSADMVARLLPKNITLETTICRTDYYVCGQIGTLNQIILNLVTNGIYSLGEKNGTITIQFGLSKEDGRFVRLVVEDNGGGIPEEIREHIFEPFFTTKEEGEGTGIGLTVVKRLVEEHGGLLKVQTETGKGTAFIMDFPYTVSQVM